MKVNCSEDKFNLDKYFMPLTKLIDSVKDESFVMTVSAPYGGGKTFFIKEWQKYLNEKKYKTLEYNAWDNDYADNPLMSFIANFKELKLDKVTWSELLKSAATVMVCEALSKAEVIGNLIARSSDNIITKVISKTIGKSITKTEEICKKSFKRNR